MKPRDMLLARLGDTIAPHLAALGFKFAPSKLSFSRTVAYARQGIDFALNKWNHENSCAFWTTWGARAKAYGQWHLEKYGEKPDNVALGGASDWNIPGWSRGPTDHAMLTGSPQSDQQVIDRLVRDIDNAGLPFLQRISSWEGAAERCLAERWMYDRAADFFLIAGQPERASGALQEGIKQFSKLGRYDNFHELPRLRERLQRFFGVSTD